MRIAALRERQDHDTFIPASAAFAAAAVFLVLTTALPPHRAEAQAGPPCTAIENDAERLACYDRALRAPSLPAPAAPAAPASATPAISAATSAPAPASAAPAASAEPADGGGRDTDDEIVALVIVSVRALPGRETIFTTDDGATWVQTDSQRLASLPDTPFAAELKPGTLGSYFLVPKEHGRAIRVRNAAR